MENEMWKPVEGYAGYEVSSMGEVRKVGTLQPLRFVAGYGMRRVTLRSGDNYKLMVVAKLVLEAFVCPQPAGYKPNVRDGNYEHLSLDNLEWVERRKKHYKKNRNNYKLKKIKR